MHTATHHLQMFEFFYVHDDGGSYQQPPTHTTYFMALNLNMTFLQKKRALSLL